MKIPTPVRNIVLAAFILVMITIFSLMLFNRNFDGFAQCLKQKGATLYCQENDAACDRQLEKFGGSARYLSRVVCEKDSIACEGITQFPTWEFSDGGQVLGIQELGQLSKLSGCKI
ncbi:MAG: hypothetical protein V1735_03565 [Nanoarchaeota archaeon]